MPLPGPLIFREMNSFTSAVLMNFLKTNIRISKIVSRTIAPRKKNNADEDLLDVELNKSRFVDDGEITAPKK